MCFNIDGLLRSNTTRLGRIRDQEEEVKYNWKAELTGTGNRSLSCS